MAEVQAIRAQMLRCFGELGGLQQNNRFLRSCISEGLIPKGIRVNFNLAKFVNDENLIHSLQDIIDEANSRVLDLVYDKNIDEEEKLLNRLEGLKESAINEAGEVEGRSVFNQMRTSNGLVIQKENRKFSAKLARLRIQKIGRAHV